MSPLSWGGWNRVARDLATRGWMDDDCDDNGYLYDVKICSKLIMYLSNGIYMYIYAELRCISMRQGCITITHNMSHTLQRSGNLKKYFHFECFFKQNSRSIFFSCVQKANFINLYSDVYVSVSVPDHANASKLRQPAT